MCRSKNYVNSHNASISVSFKKKFALFIQNNYFFKNLIFGYRTMMHTIWSEIDNFYLLLFPIKDINAWEKILSMSIFSRNLFRPKNGGDSVGMLLYKEGWKIIDDLCAFSNAISLIVVLITGKNWWNFTKMYFISSKYDYE